jgi:DNA-binding transcriptional regulator YdaS (Cro superfamily)
VAQWVDIPAERLFAVSRVTGIPIETLRPDLFKAAEVAE